ncbi:hypothetical protein [Actinomadura macrotermitis]|uniref:Uncharacterized protein n=1 Tax=Actinomadura macrotermitis TaxID=2585200 RepID=A0A7K0BRA8_9ACTN|nr:hypothetical protein [Actinomadura macrotermitis]MQY03566.1 hypothetical protein [Actinomadura macrotermitis]
MSTQVITDAEVALGHLERLTAELRSLGLLVEVAAPADRRPTALVANSELTGLNETVIAAPESSPSAGTGDGWAYYYGWGERIAPCTEPARAAALLGRVLATRRDG